MKPLIDLIGAGGACPPVPRNGLNSRRTSVRRRFASTLATWAATCVIAIAPGATSSYAGGAALITADDIAPLINSEVGAAGPASIEAYTAEHGCGVFEFSQDEFASGRPWGKPLYEWSIADVSVFKRLGLECIQIDPRNDVNQRRELSRSFELQFEGLEREVEAARQERAGAEEQDIEQSIADERANALDGAEEQLAADMRHFIDGQSTLSDEAAISRSDALLDRLSTIGGGSAAVFWEVEPQVRQIREARRGAQEAVQAELAAAPIARQLRQWLSDYASMPVPDALAAANQLLAKANALTGADYTTEIWDLTSEVMDKRYTLETAAEHLSAQAATRPACYAALVKEGHNYDWSQYPVWFDDPDFNLGDFLCWFLRTRTLGSVAVGDNWADVVVNGGTLHFETRKLLESDDFYAGPSSKAAGRVKLAIVAVSLNGQTDRLTTFTQHIKAISVIMTYQGAPFVE